MQVPLSTAKSTAGGTEVCLAIYPLADDGVGLYHIFDSYGVHILIDQ